MSTLSIYHTLDEISKNKEYKTTVDLYVKTIQSFNSQLNLLTQKLKYELGEWRKTENKDIFIL